MSVCPVCNAERNRQERVDEVFRIDGRYVLIGGIPAMVCVRCGEHSFSRQAVEKVRTMVIGQAEAARSDSVKPPHGGNSR